MSNALEFCERDRMFEVKISLTNISGLRIGSGECAGSDIDVLVGSDKMPFIPGTSMAGVLRNFFRGSSYEEYFGTRGGHSELRQSWIQVSDFFCEDKNFKVLRRDGVSIDSSRGVAKDAAKYDYEVVAPDLKFSGRICLQVPAAEESRATEFLGQVYHLFEKQKVLLGAATGFGFGRFKCNEFTCSYYDLGNKSSLKKWLCQESAPLVIKESELPTDETRFSIKAKLRDALLIRDSEGTADGPDAQHISWKKDSHYIPGTSLRGAIRARAEKILTVFVADPTKSENILRSIFGYVSTDSETEQKCSRGRLSVMDGKVEGVVSELQNRVSIDRFTGGARDGKLFDAKALFPDYKMTNAGLCEFEIKLSADAKQVEVGLMLLTLLDFARGDFAVGGEKSIGRGRFDLQFFSVQSHGKNLMISENDKFTGDIEYFQQCIQKLEQGL